MCGLAEGTVTNWGRYESAVRTQCTLGKKTGTKTHVDNRKKSALQMVQIGENVQCPECHKMGRVVWISEDKKTAGVQCPGLHSQIIRGHSKLGSKQRPQTAPEKNMVFLIEVEISPIPSAKR